MSEPIPSATIVVLRDSPSSSGLEILLTLRSSKMSVGAGDWVFPGGKIDREDAGNLSDELSIAAVAAIREAKEEVGLSLAADSTVHFSYWLTPDAMKKRFSTWFFLSELTTHQPLANNPDEVDESLWISPEEALDNIQSGKMTVTPPTYISLLELKPFNSAGEALSFYSTSPSPEYRPRIVKDNGVIAALYQDDSGYENRSLNASDPHHRTYFLDKGFRYVKTAS